MFRHVVRVYLSVLTFFVAGIAAGQPKEMDVKISDEYYHPGVVLAYESGKWTPATPAKINYSSDTYVFVHGAHSKVDHNADKVARAILKRKPKANVLSIEWSRWAVFKEKQLDDLVFELLVDYFDSEEDEIADNFDEIFDEFMENLFERVLRNLIPIEQTERIPEVAKRAEKILFERKGAACHVATDGQNGVAISLGLDPAAVMFIAHSHGCHIAGLISEICRKNRGKTVARITALDPSPGEIQNNVENANGDGWNSSSAKWVDVFRTSEFFCSQKLYGNVNLFFRDPSHPLLQLEDDDELDPFDALDCLFEGIKFEFKRHSAAIDIFTRLTKDDFFFDLPKNYDRKDSSRWIIINDD